MDNRAKCISIINSFTEEQLENVAVLLSSAKSLADEAADDAYCQQLYKDYQAETDKGEPMSLDVFAKQLGIPL